MHGSGHNYTITQPVIYVAGRPIGVSAGTAAKIKEFEHLPQGWDYGSGGAIPAKTVQKALEWNQHFYQFGFLRTNAAPGGGGQIAVATGWGDHYIEIIVNPDDTVSVAHDFKRKQELYRSHVSDADAYQIIQGIVGKIWSASTSSIQLNTIETRIDGSEWHSATTLGLYQYSGAAAFEVMGQPYANTSGNTIISVFETWFASHQFFGNSTPISSQRDAA